MLGRAEAVEESGWDEGAIAGASATWVWSCTPSFHADGTEGHSHADSVPPRLCVMK
jgi:hypothetical protein